MDIRTEKCMDKCIVVLSGGMDSTTCLRLCLEQYQHVEAITFNYGQKQKHEIELAKKTCIDLNVKHTIIDMSFMGSHLSTMSSNLIGSDIQTPTINDVIGIPVPSTYVPNRNMMMLSMVASIAEAKGITDIVVGFQSNDEYSYHDTTLTFLDKINQVLQENRQHKIQVIAPFCELSKQEELQRLIELDGNVDLLKNTLTCYNPHYTETVVYSCGVCPSCSERLKAFSNLGIIDPVPYRVME